MTAACPGTRSIAVRKERNSCNPQDGVRLLPNITQRTSPSTNVRAAILRVKPKSQNSDKQALNAFVAPLSGDYALLKSSCDKRKSCKTALRKRIRFVSGLVRAPAPAFHCSQAG